MDLRLLRYFVAIVNHGSFTQAARQLHVAQPALSQHIAHMEDELGVALLHRNSRGIAATDAGQRLYLSAQTLLGLAADIPEFVRGSVGDPAGEVRLGLCGSIGELLGATLFQITRDRHPGIRLRIVEAMSGYVQDWLRRGEIELAFVYGILDFRGLHVQQVLAENLCLFGVPGGPLTQPPGSALQLLEIPPLKLILPGPSAVLRKLVDAAFTGIPLRPIFEVDSHHHTKRLALLGEGYGILTETAIAQEVQDKVFDYWLIGDPPLRRSVYLAYSAERPLSSAAAAILNLAKDVARDLVQRGHWIAQIDT